MSRLKHASANLQGFESSGISLNAKTTSERYKDSELPKIKPYYI
jgi:hypothetical protein